MSKAIVYNQDNGVPAIIIPAPECLQTYTVFQIALKDVPPNKRFKIIDSNEFDEIQDIPQEAWVVDENDLTDGVGNTSNNFEV